MCGANGIADLAVETTVLKLELECLRGKKEGAEAAAERQFDEFAQATRDNSTNSRGKYSGIKIRPSKWRRE